MNHRTQALIKPEKADLWFPQPEEPLKDHRDVISWSLWMDEMSDSLNSYCVKFDSPESRLEGKIPHRFTL